MPKGNIVVIDKKQVNRVNPSLAKGAKCPSCGSEDILWYQYREQYSLDSGAAIYIRCQQCGHDDYTDL